MQETQWGKVLADEIRADGWRLLRSSALAIICALALARWPESARVPYAVVMVLHARMIWLTFQPRRERKRW